jgi:microcystin degradation protein MlrC
MRVGIVAIQHESNTFLRRPTTIEDFRADILLHGEQIRTKFDNANHELGGFFQGLADHRIDAVPLFAARAIPSGRITASTCDALVQHAVEAIRSAPSLDGLLLAPHGSGVSEQHRDFDGHWLSAVRKLVGPDLPIVCTLDLHANVSAGMIAACHATVAYRSNPHLDQRERGFEAATLLALHLRKEVRLTQAVALPPVAINIERQLTEEDPCRSFYALADRQLEDPHILSNSIVLGFPYSDVEEMGTSAIVVTDNNPALAQSSADALAEYLYEHRDQFLGEIISVGDALDRALFSPMPVCLLDTGDNVGGGSPADGTVLIRALHERAIGKSFAMVFDPHAVAACKAAGKGASLTLEIGGKTDHLHGSPLRLNVRVTGFHDGYYRETRVRHGGWTEGNMGPCAVVESDRGMTLLVTSRRTPPFSLQQVISAGIDPASFDYLVAKGVHAPVAAYREICRTFIRVNTPGVTNTDMSQLHFKHRRRPLFPFEQ